MKKIVISLILGMIICPGMRSALLAQESEKIEVWKLDEVVVTGTRTPHLLKDVPVETAVVTQEEIKRSSANTVSDLLKEIPGVYIRAENFPGTSAYQSQVRGLPFDSGYGLILIDGQRVLGGGMGEYGLSLNQIPICMVEKIEVIKGPSSVLYGSDAMAGVVNVITKRIPEKPTFQGEAAYGSYNTFIASGVHGQKVGPFGYFLTANHEESERGKYGAARDNYRGDHAMAKLSYDLFPQANISLNTIWDELHWNYEMNKKLRVSPQWENKFADGSNFVLKGYWYRWETDMFSPGYTRRFGDITYSQGEAQYSRPLGERHLLTLGGEYLEDDIDGNFAQKTRHTWSFYGQDEWNIVEKITMILGGRIDDHSEYGTEFNPKVSLLYEPQAKTKIRASVGRAFKSPTIRQLYVFFKHENWWNKPNPNLNPEISWGYSLGIERSFSNRVLASLTLFRNDIQDIVVRVETAETINGVPVQTWSNVQEAYTQGIEFQLKVHFSMGISAIAGYTYLDSKNRDLGKRLPFCAEHRGSLRVLLDIRPWGLHLNFGGQYTGKMYKDIQNTQRTNEYFLADFKISKDLGKFTQLSLEGTNLFNSDYGEPGRDWAGLAFLGRLTLKY